MQKPKDWNIKLLEDRAPFQSLKDMSMQVEHIKITCLIRSCLMKLYLETKEAASKHHKGGPRYS